jgi:hypothetical protein
LQLYSSGCKYREKLKAESLKQKAKGFGLSAFCPACRQAGFSLNKEVHNRLPEIVGFQVDGFKFKLFFNLFGYFD